MRNHEGTEYEQHEGSFGPLLFVSDHTNFEEYTQQYCYSKYNLPMDQRKALETAKATNQLVLGVFHENEETSSSNVDEKQGIIVQNWSGIFSLQSTKNSTHRNREDDAPEVVVKLAHSKRVSKVIQFGKLRKSREIRQVSGMVG